MSPRVAIFCDVACHLGVGPSYDPASGALFWFDILGKTLLGTDFAGGDPRIHDLPEMASAIAADDAGRQLVVTETGLYVLPSVRCHARQCGGNGFGA